MNQVICPQCKGKKIVQKIFEICNGSKRSWFYVKCPYCDGNGYVTEEKEKMYKQEKKRKNVKR